MRGPGPVPGPRVVFAPETFGVLLQNRGPRIVGARLLLEIVMRIHLALAALCAVGMASCGDEDTPEPDVGVDVGPDVPPEDCTGVDIALVVGDECGGPARCGSGTQCAQVGDELSGFCRQICIPGTCESICQAGEECATLAESPGTGVCVERRLGSVQAYEVCSDDEPCADPYSCLVRSASAQDGVCLPPCDPGVGCTEHNGRAGECRIRVESGSSAVSYCAALCPSGSDDDCPGEMSCLETESGTTVCAYGPD